LQLIPRQSVWKCDNPLSLPVVLLVLSGGMVFGLVNLVNRHALLRDSRLYVLLGGCGDGVEFENLARTLVAAGVHIIQLRDKRAGDARLLERARLLREITRQTGTLFIMNDRPDLAMLADADGVHLGQDDAAVRDARRVLGAERIVGVSTHRLAEVRRAARDGADYIGCGPTFPSETKHFDRFVGLDFLRQVSGEARCPAFAIGGIDVDNLPLVLETGFRRIAVGAAVVAAADPAARVEQLLAMLGGC
jgi:thiamine-phosphate pyrophosphorylase